MHKRNEPSPRFRPALVVPLVVGSRGRGPFRNAPLEGPFPLGHECLAEVIKTASLVHAVRFGDRVIDRFIAESHAALNAIKG